MSMVCQYVVVGTFTNCDDGIILGCFATLEEAKEFDYGFESDDIEFTHIYKLEVAEV